MTATARAIELTEIAALAAADKLARDIVAYDVSEQLAITDAFLLCSGANDRQVRSIIDEVELRLSRPAPPWSAARARTRAAGCCLTTWTSWSTSRTRRSASSTRSSGSGRTAR